MSLGAAVAIGLASATPAEAANQALMINGIGGGAALPDLVMSEVLGGRYADYDRRNVDWPQQARPVIGLRYSLAESIDIGADNLDAAIRQALTEIGPGEHVTVVGLSAGSLVADEELRRLAANPNIDPSLLNFVVVGDSSRISLNKDRHDPFLDYTYIPPVDSPYNTISVIAEYDGFADFPDRMDKLIAVANAIAGEMISHVPSMFSDLSDAQSVRATVTTNSLGGVTTDYVISPDRLPLVQLMPLLGLFGEAQLKSIIDSAYVRNDPPRAEAPKDAAASPATALPAASALDAPDPTSEATVPPAEPGLPKTEAPEAPELDDATDSPAVVGGHRSRPAPDNIGPGVKVSGGQRDGDSPRTTRGRRAS